MVAVEKMAFRPPSRYDARMGYEISAFSPNGVVIVEKPSAADAHAAAREFEARGFSEVRIKAPDGFHYGVRSFLSVVPTRPSSDH